MMNCILNDIATCNFYFSGYVKIWTLITVKDNSCQV